MIDFSKPTALYGGSFDPVHEGHLHVAREVLSALPQIKQIIFIPSARSPGKSPPLASPEQRLHWLSVATESAATLVWDIELLRAGESYTVDTLETAHQLGAGAKRLFWILGADAYAGFQSWKKPDHIRTLCQLVVVSRPGSAIQLLSHQDIVLPISPHPASSSEIRLQLASGNSYPPGLPPKVRAEIEKILPLHNPYVRKI